MKKPIVDHWWSKIVESDERGLAAARDKWQELMDIEHKIAKSEGGDVASNVMDGGLLLRALERCIEIHNGEEELDQKDLHIYHRYATAAAKEAEKTIDTELTHLGL